MTKRFNDFIVRNRNVQYMVSFEKLPCVSAIHKWVGAQNNENYIYGIPNDMNAILKHDIEGNNYLGKLGSELFKWTGGCIWKNSLYAFPRTSNYLLKMSLDTEKTEYISVEEKYKKEHHYGGVLIKDGIVYQPPRNSNHFLVWDLKTRTSRKIYILNKLSGKTYRYCGSVLHPNGYIYFIPEKGERIIKLNTLTEEWSYIGEKMDAMVFDAKVSVDGNIYGFSAYCKGILKIDVKNDFAEMLHQEINAGAYGTKLGINGHLYSIPGNGNDIWDYDPITDSLEKIYQFPYELDAKYAGGTSLRNGNIYAVPAKENQLLMLKADVEDVEIPKDIFQNFFVDCY